MSVKDLIATMVFLLKKLDAAKKGVTAATIHRAILGDDDPHNEQVWYEGMISTIIKANNGTNPDWPSKWMDMSSSALAKALLA